MPSTGRQLRSFSQKIVSIHQGSEGRSLSHLAIVLIFLPGEIFLLLAFGALCERWALCCSSTLPPYRSPGRGRPETWHISLIVSSKGAIWGDDSEDLRFIVLHGELRSKQGALDVFLSLMTGATLKCKQFSCAKGKKLRSSECPPTLYLE